MSKIYCCICHQNNYEFFFLVAEYLLTRLQGITDQLEDVTTSFSSYQTNNEGRMGFIQ